MKYRHLLAILLIMAAQANAADLSFSFGSGEIVPPSGVGVFATVLGLTYATPERIGVGKSLGVFPEVKVTAFRGSLSNPDDSGHRTYGGARDYDAHYFLGLSETARLVMSIPGGRYTVPKARFEMGPGISLQHMTRRFEQFSSIETVVRGDLFLRGSFKVASRHALFLELDFQDSRNGAALLGFMGFRTALWS